MRYRLDLVPYVCELKREIGGFGKRLNCRVEEAGESLRLAATAFPNVQRLELTIAKPQDGADALLLTPVFCYCGAKLDNEVSGKQLRFQRV